MPVDSGILKASFVITF